MTGRPPTPEPVRFERKVLVDANGCWLWQSTLDRGGYGKFTRADRTTCRAHRWSYEHHVGPIPDGMSLDHLCRVHRCVNPMHLEPVTSLENFRRGEAASARAARTGKCKRGHGLAGDNLIVNARGQRSCKTCQRMKAREWVERQRAKAVAS